MGELRNRRDRRDFFYRNANIVEYAVTLSANRGSAFTPAPVLWVNDCPITIKAVDEQTLQFDYSFWGPTFTPALYDGVDYALLYQYDYFLAQNPEVIEACGTGPEDVLEYYAYYGLSYGLRAIAAFDAEVFIANYESKLDFFYMCDVEMSTLHYLEHAYDEELLGIPEAVYPQPADN